MTRIAEDVVKAERSLNYRANYIQSNDPYETRIRAISPDISHIERATFLEQLLQDMAQELSELACDARVHIIQEHFRLSEQDVQGIRQTLKRYRKQPKTAPPNPALSQDEIIERLERQSPNETISPAQDFQNGVMYFTVMIDRIPHMISSDRRVISFDDAEKDGLILQNSDVDTSRFSPQGVAAFLKGSYKLSIPDLYSKIHSYITRFIVFPNDRLPVYLALWVIGTYVFKVFDYFPYVWLNAEKGSGKTLLMKVLSRIAFNGEVLINPTEAVIFRDVANNSISMFIDEVEQLRKQDKEAHRALISLLNSGYERGSCVKRVEKSAKGSFVIRKYPAYSPKMFAGINEIDDVLLDRTFCVRLWRKKADETVERYRETDALLSLQRQIRDDCYVLALQDAADLARVYQSTDATSQKLCHLDNRELDLWEPIMLLAEMIDTGLGSNDIADAMKSLSAESMAHKQEASVNQNDTYKMLAVVKEMLNNMTPLETKDGNLTFTSDSVFGYFQRSDEFGWLQDKSKGHLTRMLLKIEVRRGQQKVDGKNARTYIINLKTFEDLCVRFRI